MASFKPTKQIGVGGFEFGAKEKKYIEEVIKSNRLSYGPWSQKFEHLVAEEHGCEFGIFLNSGTSALQIALAAMKEKYGWHDGDEVLVPAITFIATSNIVIYNNMKPVFVDVDRRTYNINPLEIEAAITQKTRAILPVHLFGMPCDMDPIMNIAQKYELKVLEDSCETMFASYNGKKVGSFGDIGCFSTYMAHFLVTGVGGIAITSDPDLMLIMRSFMNHGRDPTYLSIDDDKSVSQEELSLIVEKRFSFVRLGHSMRNTELEAAIGVAQFEERKQIIKKRIENAKFYSENLADLEEHLQLPYIPPDRDHFFMLYPIVVKDEPKRDLVNYLEERSIETRDLMPIVNQPVYRKLFGDIENNYPVAKWINENGFYIGCHPYLATEEKQYVVDTIHEYFAGKT